MDIPIKCSTKWEKVEKIEPSQFFTIIEINFWYKGNLQNPKQAEQCSWFLGLLLLILANLFIIYQSELMQCITYQNHVAWGISCYNYSCQIVHSFHFENDQTLPAFIAFKNIVRITKQCLRLHTFQAGEIKYNLQICTWWYYIEMNICSYMHIDILIQYNIYNYS